MQRVLSFSYSIFIVRYKTGRDYRVPLWVFFGPMRPFFEFFCLQRALFKFFGIMRLAKILIFRFFVFFLEIFLMSRKGPPSIFKRFGKIIDISQSQRVPSSRFFGTMKLFKIVIFRLKLDFLSIYLPIFFSKTIRNLDVISWVKRCIRIFDVISELYSVLRRRRRFEKRSHLGQHAISEVWDVTPRNKFDFQKTQRVPPFTISKSLSFLSLRYGADFRRSRLVNSLQQLITVINS